MKRLAQCAVLVSGALMVSACTASFPVTTVGPSPSHSPTADPTAHNATAPTPSPSSASSPDPLAALTQAELEVPGGPDFPIAAFDSVWLLTPDGDPPSVRRIDPATNDIVATIPTDSRLCQALGATHDALWTCVASGIAPIDPATNALGPPVEFDQAATMFVGYLPFGAGSLWALGGDAVARDLVVRIDPSAHTVTDAFDLDFDATWMSYGADSLWLTDTSGGALWRLDPHTGEVVEHTTDLPGPGPSSFGAGSVWLAVRVGPDDRPTATDVTLVRIDPATGEIQAEIVLGGTIGEIDLHATDEAIWVRSADPFLARIDPATDQVVETFHTNALGGSVTVGFDSVWVTSYRLNKVWRVDPD